MMVEGDVTFNKAYSTPPQIVMGMFGFDLSCKTRLQFSSAVSNITTTGFHMKVQADGDSCIAESAWNWIENPAGWQLPRLSERGVVNDSCAQCDSSSDKDIGASKLPHPVLCGSHSSRVAD